MARSTVETYVVPDGSAFLFDSVSEAGYALDQLGALVWDYCDGHTAIDRIIEEVAELLPGDEGVANRVRQWLIEFAEEGLLDSSATSTGSADAGD